MTPIIVLPLSLSADPYVMGLGACFSLMVLSFIALRGFCHLPGARERMRQSVALCYQGCLWDNGVPQVPQRQYISYFFHPPPRLAPRVWNQEPLLTASLQRGERKGLTNREVSQTTAFPSDALSDLENSRDPPTVPSPALLYTF